VQEGDEIAINVSERTIELKVSDDELAARRKTWKPLPSKITTGYLARYARQVSSAAQGAVVKAEADS
ncbi:MAG: dihydroxy-acid dehydratase, partial [Armatimonadota bacterium]|nr:dihydroxy-acid dehydratase [Armatimonadota bacterium]